MSMPSVNVNGVKAGIFGSKFLEVIPSPMMDSTKRNLRYVSLR
jgi:hypothetical protein